MKILVLGGGISPEREVSLRSAKAVAMAAFRAGFEVVKADPQDGLTILDKIEKNTIVFPILHGAGGEDGELQAELERRNLPFLGSGSEVSRNCFDKWQARLILQKSEIPMVEAVKVTKTSYATEELVKKPHVLKIVHGGSSIGSLIVRNPSKTKTEKQHEKAQRLAEKVHQIMGCRHLSRVDTIMQPNGSFVVLEINTMPGLTDQSLYPKAAAVSGFSMSELVKEFVELVKRDYSI